MEEKHRQALKNCLLELRTDLNVNDVLVYLQAKGIINEHQHAKIMAKVTVFDQRYEAFTILQTLGPDAFNIFLEALNKHGNAHLAQRLMDSVLVIEQGRFEASQIDNLVNNLAPLGLQILPPQRPVEFLEAKTLVAIGRTGNGKSTLCNVLYGHPDFFKESAQVDSETRCAIAAPAMFKGKSVYLIDTPGLKDSEGVDKENIKNTVQFLKDHQYGLHGIVFVLNGQDPRIDSTDKDLIRLLCNIFNADEFWEHMCILFTRCINHPSVMFNESERRTDYDRKIREIAKEMQIELPDGEIQAFFVDLKDSSNQKSIQNIENLKDWLLQLGPIGRMDQMKAADNKIKNTDVEKRPRLTHSEKLYEKKRRGGIAGLFGGSHMRCHATRDWYVDEEREVQTQYDGTISYGEWKTTRTWYEDRA